MFVFMIPNLLWHNTYLPGIYQLFSARFAITDQLLGHGGYGTVHMARDLATKEMKQVACKVLRFDSTKFTKRTLMKEVEILMSLNHVRYETNI